MASETIEIIKEARKAGMQTALLMFACMLIMSGLFGYYIYKSYDIAPSNHVEAEQTTNFGDNNITNGGK